MEFLGKFAAKPALTAAALCIAVFVVAGDLLLTGALLDRQPDLSEPAALLINGLLVAAPFLLLAYRGSARLLPWITGIVLTLWLWWRFMQAGVAYQRAPDGSGVDMGFGLLMVVSPALIAAVCVLIDRIMVARSRNN